MESRHIHNQKMDLQQYPVEGHNALSLPYLGGIQVHDGMVPHPLDVKDAESVSLRFYGGAIFMEDGHAFTMGVAANGTLGDNMVPISNASMDGDKSPS